MGQIEREALSFTARGRGKEKERNKVMQVGSVTTLCPCNRFLPREKEKRRVSGNSFITTAAVDPKGEGKTGREN